MALFGAKKTDPKKVDSKKTDAKSSPKNEKSVSMQDLYQNPTATPSLKKTKAVAAGVKGVGVHSAGASGNLIQRVLVKPLITEKAANLKASDKYSFVVADGANKISVAAAVFAIYGVKPVKVNLLNVLGKKVARGKVRGQRSNWRKAIVTLKPGETIKIYEGV